MSKTMPSPMLAGPLRLITLFVLIACSQQYVEEILRGPEPKMPKASCKDCDITELPDGSYFLNKCDPYSTGQCGADGSQSYECCVGYQLMPDTRMFYQPKGCQDEYMKLSKCIREMALNGQVNPSAILHIERLFKSKKLDPNAYYTIFVPIRSVNGSEAETLPEDQYEYHIIKGKYYSHDLHQGLQLYSALQADKRHHVTRFQDLLFMDCIEVLEADRECPNGVVHLIQRALKPLPEVEPKQTSLKELLDSDDDIDGFFEALPEKEREDLMESLSRTNNITILAPNKAKWAKLRETYDEEAMATIARNHIIYEDSYCLKALIKKNIVGSVIGEKLNVTGDISKRRKPPTTATITSPCNEPRTVERADSVQPRGVVHRINEPIIPCSLKGCVKPDKLNEKGEKPPACLKDVDTWWSYLKACDLYIEADQKYTYVLPTNAAFEWWKTYEPFAKEYQRFLDNEEYRCAVIRYHVIATPTGPSVDSAKSEQSVPFRTNNRDKYAPNWQSVFQGRHQSPYKHEKDLWHHYGRMIDPNPVAYNNAWAARTDRVLMLPEYNITDFVNSQDDMSRYASIHENANARGYFSENAPRNLHLTVRDAGMDGYVLAEKNYPTYLRLHTIQNYLWGGDIGYFISGNEYKYPNGKGLQLIFKRETTDGRDVMRIGYEGLDYSQWPTVVEYNHRAMDGIVWVLDKPLPCPQEYCGCAPPELVDQKSEEPPACLPEVDQWWSYLKNCDLYIEPKQKYTYVIPVNKAFDWWKSYQPFAKEYERFQSDGEYRCAVIRYHVMATPENHSLSGAQLDRTVHYRTNNRGVYAPNWQSVYSSPDKSPYEYPNYLWHHYGRMIDRDPYSYNNAWIVRTDRVLMLPDYNITDFVKSQADMSRYTSIHENANARGYFSEKAPRNLHLTVRDAGMEGYQLAERNYAPYLRLHTIQNYLWGGDIGYFISGNEYKYPNGGGLQLIFKRETTDGRDVMRIGYEGLDYSQWPAVVEYNHRAMDGIVWVLDKPLPCPEAYCPSACDFSTPIDWKGDVPECLRPHKVDQWWNYLRECDLYIAQPNKYEVLFPVNDGFDWWKGYAPFAKEYERFMNDQDYRCAVIRYHIMLSEGGSARVGTGVQDLTVHYRSNNRAPYAPQWQSLYYGQGDSAYKAPGNYWYHYGRVMDNQPFAYPYTWVTRIDRPLMLPETNVTQYLATRNDLSISYKVVDRTGYNEYISGKAPRNLYLFVKNDGLSAIFDEEGQMQHPVPYVHVDEGSDGTLEKQLEEDYASRYTDKVFNKDYGYNFSEWHTIPSYYWAGDIGYYSYDQTYYMTNALNFKFHMKRELVDGVDRLRIGYPGIEYKDWSTVIEYNRYARDGMIWVLDRPLTCPNNTCRPTVVLKVTIFTLKVVSCRTDMLEHGQVDKKHFSKEMDTVADENPDDCVAIWVNDYNNFKRINKN